MPLSRARMRERKRQDRLVVKPVSNLDVRPTVKPVIPKLQAMIHGIEANKPVQPVLAPWYDSSVHKAGDMVRVKSYGKIKTIVIPELDAEGNPM